MKIFATLCAAAIVCLGAPAFGQYYDEGRSDIEWEAGEGYHEEEWYDPSDWADTDYGIEYETDDWGWGYGDYGYYDEGWYDDDLYDDEFYDYGYGYDGLYDEGYYDYGYGFDDYGYYDTGYDWYTDDEWYGDWYGDADDDWLF